MRLWLRSILLQATPGVQIYVHGLPKDTQHEPVAIGHNDTQGGVTYMGGDWVTTNITFPPQGLDNLTFVYTVPLGFDDLSAAVCCNAACRQCAVRVFNA